MGHPPATKSDLSLVEFLEAIKEYHSKPENVNKVKIVKLDFKSIEATERSIEMLEKGWKKVNKILKSQFSKLFHFYSIFFQFFVSFSSRSRFGLMLTFLMVQVVQQHRSMLDVLLLQLKNWEKLRCQLVGPPVGIQIQLQLTHMIMQMQ